MAQATTRSTVVSTKGQVILPQAIRKRRQWSAGTRLIVEDTPEGVLLKAAPFFPPSKPEEVFGSLHTGEPAKSLKEMDDASHHNGNQTAACSRSILISSFAI
jgi:AbrB family looped-hinge helix DNA binding protein